MSTFGPDPNESTREKVFAWLIFIVGSLIIGALLAFNGWSSCC